MHNQLPRPHDFHEDPIHVAFCPCLPKLVCRDGAGVHRIERSRAVGSHYGKGSQLSPLSVSHTHCSSGAQKPSRTRRPTRGACVSLVPEAGHRTQRESLSHRRELVATPNPVLTEAASEDSSHRGHKGAAAGEEYTIHFARPHPAAFQ